MAMLAGCGFSINLGDNNTPTDARPDGTTTPDMEIDAPKVNCGPSFHQIGTGTYLVLDPANFRSHMTACATHAGAHLAVIDDLQEMVELAAFGRTVMGVMQDSRFYIGMVQAPAQDSPEKGWIDFQDRDSDADLWSTSGANEPNDGPDENENNHQEQVAAIRIDRDHLVDLSSGENVRAYCECDGIPIGPKAASYLLAPDL
jgi:hypothetical protein